MENKVQEHLKKFTRGLAQNSSNEIFTSHRDLFYLGKCVVPIVRKQLIEQSWEKISSGAQLNILTGLLSLVHDIDENESKEIGKEIEKHGCSIIALTRIKTITEFTLNKFNSYSISGVKIYQSKSLHSTEFIKKMLKKWLNDVPNKDIDRVERIYIIPESKESHTGTYTPILCNIMVEWNLPVHHNNPVAQIYMLGIEKTLFHEIGHHVGNHTFGQDTDQEREADLYAYKILKKNHPILHSVFGFWK